MIGISIGFKIKVLATRWGGGCIAIGRRPILLSKGFILKPMDDSRLKLSKISNTFYNVDLILRESVFEGTTLFL
jgi:hypothetical protein